MNQGRYVFAQFKDFFPRYDFDKCVLKYNGDYRVRSFNCWSQLLCLVFGQLTHRESLRDIVTCLNSRGSSLYHLGIKGGVSRSTLLDANQRRDWRIYADFAQILMKEAKALYQGDSNIDLELDQSVYAIDSSLIHLCLNTFFWAKYRKTTSAVKVHTVLDVKTALPVHFSVTDGLSSDMNLLSQLFFEPGSFYVMDRGYTHFEQLYRIEQCKANFVIRAKSALKFRRQYSNPCKEYPNIICDQIGVFTVPQTKKKYPEKVRRIKSKDADTGKTIILLTNNMVLKPDVIADLYRHRWRIEIFFRWIKQHLRIKVFWGESENAVMTQIWVAVSAYLLVAIMKKKLKIPQSLHEILQILSVSLLDKVPMNQLFTESALQKADYDSSNQLNIFDL